MPDQKEQFTRSGISIRSQSQALVVDLGGDRQDNNQAEPRQREEAQNQQLSVGKLRARRSVVTYAYRPG